jgi:hypothetical protein
VAPARLQRVGVQRQVVVGQVEAAGPPAGERLGDRHLELPRRRGLVDVVDPGVGHQRQRVGVVQQVGPAAPGRRGEGGLGPLQRRLVGGGRDRADVGGRAEAVEHRPRAGPDQRDHRGGDAAHGRIEPPRPPPGRAAAR